MHAGHAKVGYILMGRLLSVMEITVAKGHKIGIWLVKIVTISRVVRAAPPSGGAPTPSYRDVCF